MTDERTPPPVPTPPEKGARGGVPSAVPDGDLQSFTRAFASGAKPVIIGNAKLIGGAFAVLLLSAAQHWSGKADTDKKTEVAYSKLADPVNEHAADIEELRKAVAQLADTVQLQGRLLLASRPGFTPAGQPDTAVPAAAPASHARQRRAAAPAPADPKLVKQVRDNAVKGLATLKAQIKESVAPPKTAPPTLDSQTPVPLPQIRDAGRSP